MTENLTTDIARLYHLHSSNVRERTVETDTEGDDKPQRRRTYPGAPRFPLPGRSFRIRADFGDVLARRRSVRSFSGAPLPAEALGRLLFASHGAAGRRRGEGIGGHQRSSPSAGGLYPIELYVALSAVEGLADGVYHYDALDHALEALNPGNKNDLLVDLTMGQDMVQKANVICVVTAVRARTMFKYGQRGYRYLFLDAGHVGQSLYLVATALGLGPVGIGGFLDREIGDLCRLPSGEDALYILAFGQPDHQGGSP